MPFEQDRRIHVLQPFPHETSECPYEAAMSKATKSAALAVADTAPDFTDPRPGPPADLHKDGRELWAAIMGDLSDGWRLDARELRLLARACRCADEAAELEAAIDRDGATVEGSRKQLVVHPGIAEGRQLRLAELRLLREIEMTDPNVSRSRSTPSARRARRAAETRWRESV
jgi:hypothetical protein